MDNYSVGIDFGTCNIKVSWFNYAKQMPAQLKLDKKDSNSDKNVQNAINYESREDYSVGSRAAKKRRTGNTVEYIKRKLELKHWEKKFTSLGFSLSAEEIAADIFSWINKAINNLGKSIEDAVITVPVCFSEVQKEKILSCAEKAGINVIGALTEPVAALFSIDELFEDECDENIVVFDFGGATLDLCLVHVENDGCGDIIISVESSYGLKLGGMDITNAIYDDIIYPANREFIDNEIKDEPAEKRIAEDEIREICNGLKMSIFENEDEIGESAEDTFFSECHPGVSESFSITGDDVIACFEKNRFKERIVSALDTLFDESEIDRNQVTMVKPFGGSSRIVYFRQILSEYFGTDIFDYADYDSDIPYGAVADGAARYLSIIKDDDSSVDIYNSIPYYLGVSRKGSFVSVVQKNQKYRKMKPYKPLTDIIDVNSENWEISVYQSFADENIKLDEENDSIAYFGRIELDKEKYSNCKCPLYSFGVDKTGKIFAVFSITDENNEIIEVERKNIVIGG